MRSAGDWIRSSWGIISIAVIIVTIAASTWARYCGLLLTPDSVNYLAAAESFRSSDELLNPDGTAFAYWPPLFPVVLSLFSEPATALFWLNFPLIALAGILMARQSEPLIANIWLRAGYLVLNLVGVQFIMTTTFLWSELIFIVLALYLFRPNASPTTTHNLLTTVTGLLLCLQRHAGVFFVVAWAVSHLLDSKNRQQIHITRTLIMAVVMVSGSIAWNWHISASPGSGFSIMELDYFSSAVINLTPLTKSLVHTFLPIEFASLILFPLLFITCTFLLREEVQSSLLTRQSAVLVVTYLLGMSVLFRLDVHDRDRYTAVILPFFSMLLFGALQKVADRQTSGTRRMLIVLVIAWLIYPLSRTARNVVQWHAVSCSRAVLGSVAGEKPGT